MRKLIPLLAVAALLSTLPAAAQAAEPSTPATAPPARAKRFTSAATTTLTVTLRDRQGEAPGLSTFYLSGAGVEERVEIGADGTGCSATRPAASPPT
ncbi:hypothetical protein AB0I28_16880 [Phytomonospora sp. NPDC050363]|uniref:hypothetical protein n=1 Tax=Phytomonospora sp. NPDC050363 TaxID=3155642 RepID=UPI0033C150F7